MTAEMEQALASIDLKVLFNPHTSGLEDDETERYSEGSVVGGRYRVVDKIGSGNFSDVFQCWDLRGRRMVSLKVMNHERDCFETGISEVRMLQLAAQLDPGREQPLLRHLEHFYHCERLVIVTELLDQTVSALYRHLETATESGVRLAFFDQPTLRALSTQMLHALASLHRHDVRHCDVKPENICLAKGATRRRFKLIDFGSAVLKHDYHNSYVQSRWYRAPEVMLGVAWDGGIDLWSLGCVLAEIVLGYPIFRQPTVEGVIGARA